MQFTKLQHLYHNCEYQIDNVAVLNCGMGYNNNNIVSAQSSGDYRRACKRMVQLICCLEY